MIFLLFRIMDMKTAQKQLTRETGKCVPYRSQYISDSSMGTGTQHRETFIADQRHRQQYHQHNQHGAGDIPNPFPHRPSCRRISLQGERGQYNKYNITNSFFYFPAL